MESGPAVVVGLMTAELHPFAVALERKKSVGRRLFQLAIPT
jgi:hypothetical protein